MPPVRFELTISFYRAVGFEPTMYTFHHKGMLIKSKFELISKWWDRRESNPHERIKARQILSLLNKPVLLLSHFNHIGSNNSFTKDIEFYPFIYSIPFPKELPIRIVIDDNVIFLIRNRNNHINNIHNIPFNNIFP